MNLLTQYQEPAQELTAKAGTVVTNGIAIWSWVAHVNEILQLVITALGVATGYATYRYMRAKRKLMEKQLNDHKEVGREE